MLIQSTHNGGLCMECVIWDYIITMNPIYVCRYDGHSRLPHSLPFSHLGSPWMTTHPWWTLIVAWRCVCVRRARRNFTRHVCMLCDVRARRWGWWRQQQQHMATPIWHAFFPTTSTYSTAIPHRAVNVRDRLSCAMLSTFSRNRPALSLMIIILYSICHDLNRYCISYPSILRTGRGDAKMYTYSSDGELLHAGRVWETVKEATTVNVCV